MQHWIESDCGISLAKPGSPTENARVVWIARWNDDTFTIGEECDGHFSIDATRDQLIETLEEALEWVKAQARASDPLVQAMDDAVKRLAALGIGMMWRYVFVAGKVWCSGQKEEDKRVIAVQMTCPKNAIFGRYERRQVTEYPNYTAVEIEFSSIEEVEQFIADNTHLAN